MSKHRRRNHHHHHSHASWIGRTWRQFLHFIDNLFEKLTSYFDPKGGFYGQKQEQKEVKFKEDLEDITHRSRED